MNDYIYILKEHGIESYTDGGNLYALEIGTRYGIPYSKWLNVTSWSRSKLFAWLGY